MLVTLDGLRGIAALAVVTFHYQSMLGPFVFPSAYLAVDLFFLISGIVIAQAYEGRLSSAMTPRAFMARRIVRLMPLYLLGLVIGAAVTALGIAMGRSQWDWLTWGLVVLAGAIMLPNPFPAPRGELYPLNIPCWSLFWELVINVIYALTLPWLRTGVLIAVFLVTQVLLAIAARAAGGLDFGYDWRWPVIGLLRVTGGFTGGVLIARSLAAGRWTGLRAPPALLLLIAAVLMALPTGLGWIKDVACASVAFPLLCLFAVHSQPRSTRVYLWLGLISYPLYVTHAVLPWNRLLETLAQTTPEALSPWSGLVAVMAAVILASALAVLYDLPVRHWLARRRDTNS